MTLEPLKLDPPAGKKPDSKKPDPKKPDPKAGGQRELRQAGRADARRQVRPLPHRQQQGQVQHGHVRRAARKAPRRASCIFPRKSQGSRIVEVIETGDMPRGGAKVTKDELAALAKWIDEGAMFDGPNETTAVRQLVGNARRAAKEQPKLEIVQATGKESSSFSRDVAQRVRARTA